jgi:hypothetical protein
VAPMPCVYRPGEQKTESMAASFWLVSTSLGD